MRKSIAIIVRKFGSLLHHLSRRIDRSIFIEKKSDFENELNRWNNDRGDQELRIEYPLNEESSHRDQIRYFLHSVGILYEVLDLLCHCSND